MEVALISRLHEMVNFDPTPHFIALLSSTKFLGPPECFRDQKEGKKLTLQWQNMTN